MPKVSVSTATSVNCGLLRNDRKETIKSWTSGCTIASCDDSLHFLSLAFQTLPSPSRRDRHIPLFSPGWEHVRPSRIRGTLMANRPAWDAEPCTFGDQIGVVPGCPAAYAAVQQRTTRSNSRQICPRAFK